MRRTGMVGLLTACVLVLWGGRLPAAEVTLAPASERFAAAGAEEVPDFQRHTVPLLGKLGCNGRACHGSFQGRGGFQLSLFGYDFKMDHAGLLDRIDTNAAADSYALHKALLTEPHEGGKRMDEGSWEHHLLLRWIESGAAPRADDAPELVRLEVTPNELLFSEAGQQIQLQAVAVWGDGTREDVTCLTRFQSNDEVIADITPGGLVTCGEPGDTHVGAFYDNAVVPLPVLRPVSDLTGDRYPQLAAATAIDDHILTKLRKLGVVPSDLCTDEEFLRRVSLDITGTLPTVEQVRAFLADTSADKRARKIDELLNTEAYASWWTTRLCDWTGCNDEQLNNVNPVRRQAGSRDWYDWIHARVAKNVAYDDLVEGIVVAQSRLPDESYRDYCERMSDCYRDESASFADQPGLIYFWGRQNFRTTEDRAIGFAYTFMGTRIQCAQCHKHPFDVWTQSDFQQFEQFFTRVNFARNGRDKDEFNEILKAAGIDLKNKNGNEQRRAIENAIGEGKTIPFPELVVQQERPNRRKTKEDDAPQATTARLLGSAEVNLAEIEDPRTALMDWLRQDEKRLFAKSFVNRVWANYFHRGIVEPTDDLSLANPPANQALLDYLAEGFIASGYDMKWVHREICRSDAYQRSWRPNETNRLDERNFSRGVPRRLPAEAAYDALQLATASDEVAGRFLSDMDSRAIAIPGVGRNATTGPNYALTVFGRSTRDSNCDCDRSAEASLLQVVFTRNDADIYRLMDRNDGWLRTVTRGMQGDEAKSEGDERRLASLEAQLASARQRLAKAKQSGKQKQAELVREKVEELKSKIAELRPETPEPSAAPALDASSLVEDAYLRTLSRKPSSAEVELGNEFINTAATPAEGLRGLLWTLLNTKEFIVNH
ncbi:MAG: DUF1549 domain-containing protein [Planctomycetaceae bacterium]